MRISRKNNNFENQPIGDNNRHNSKMNYEGKDIANSPDPAEYLGRSQVSFKGIEQTAESRKIALKQHLKDNHINFGDEYLDLLNPVAEAIQNDDELQFMKDCLLEKRSDRFVFSPDDLLKLLMGYQKHPEQIKDVMNKRCDDGELYYTSADSITAIADAYAIDKEYADIVLQISSFSRKSIRFTPADARCVVEAAQIDKDFVNSLLAQETKYESDRAIYRTNEKFLAQLKEGKVPNFEKQDGVISHRYSGPEIKAITEAHAIDPDFTNYILNLYDSEYISTDSIKTIVEKAQADKDFVVSLINYTKTDNRGEKQPRFELREIADILDNTPKDKQFIYKILNKTQKNALGEDVYAYKPNTIVAITKAAKLNEPMTKNLLYMKYKYNGKMTNRFKPEAIETLVNDYKSDKRLFNYMLNKTERTYNNEEHPIYSSHEIHSIISASKRNKQLVEQLLKSNHHASFIENIVNAYEKDPDYTNYLLSLKFKDNSGREYGIIKDYEYESLIDAHKEDPEYTDKILSIRQTDSDGYIYTRFDGATIKQLVHHAQDKRKFVDYIINSVLIRSEGDDHTLSNKDIIETLNKMTSYNPEYLDTLISETKTNSDGKEIPKYKPSEILMILSSTSLDEYKNLLEKAKDNIDNYSLYDIVAGCEFVNMYARDKISEIPLADRKNYLRKLVATNANLFDTSDTFRKDFPLIPQNQKEYCELLPSIVHSLGIETKELSEEQIDNFNENMMNLSDSLANLSDDEFNSLTITQEYDRDDFIKDTLEIIKDLDPNEQQQVYDYFGFELRENPKNNQTGYSLIGYPVNLNNGKKLAEIEDTKTKEVVERLRPYVIKFSENNRINANNLNIENELNAIADVLPEIRTMIGKVQHKTHDFDVFKHSLKVMQKVRQDKDFEKLNDSDKKVMLLASLMHDITKTEYTNDKTHPTQSAFDTLFISKKFNLPQDEEIKLYTLIQHHEWLSHVNSKKTEEETAKAQQSVAFDLQQNNLFDMALLFTHADLKAVKNSDLFHDTTEGNSRVDMNDQRRSYGQAADFHAEKIREYIKELKKTQPLLPTTKMPKASDIEKLITEVNPDGSTNIKGVYIKENKDKKRLVVLKFNEVEDDAWENMGLPKGSSTKGTVIKYEKDGKLYNVETGNIKFFVHGLEYPNQLAKFDAFSLLNSDALLSVSYAERPETKYRFFRPQGVMLDVSADYVYGGGPSDGGSGFGKTIQQFKDGYTFGGYRESDRKFVSDLIKYKTDMNDDEYIKFYDNNKNKPMTDIEPPKLRERLIKSFAIMDSRNRLWNREYNEMYLSNPKSVMGVFAYEMSENKNISDPLQFLEENKDRTEFLQNYAVEHDVPFVLFGD